MRDPDKVFERVKERAEQYELQRLRRKVKNLRPASWNFAAVSLT